MLAYADDIVLLSPSWRDLQKLLNIIEKTAAALEMSFNTNKTVCIWLLTRMTGVDMYLSVFHSLRWQIVNCLMCLSLNT